MRTKKAAINSSVNVINKIITLVLSFISRTIFIYIFGNLYLGLNALFISLLSFFSIAEMGIGSAIIYSMYKPLAEKDEKLVAAYINYYKILYRYIGLIILAIGLVFLPFLHLFTTEFKDINEIYLFYIIFLSSSVSGYFVSYKRNIFLADQKEYLVTIVGIFIYIVTLALQISFMLLLKSYLVYLLIQTVLVFVGNLIINVYTGKKYAFLSHNKNEVLDKERKKELYKNVKALFIHKTGSILILAIDNLVISAYIGLREVGIYSNYTMIMSSAVGILNAVFASFIPVIGNLKLSNDDTICEKRFREIALLNHWLYGLLCVGFLVAINCFFHLWLGNSGEDYLFGFSVVFCLILKVYFLGANDVAVSFVSAGGFFVKNKYKPIIETLINAIFCIIFVHFWGIMGILLATIISVILCTMWFDPFILYKHWFKKSPVKYFFQYWLRVGIMLALALSLTYFCDFLFPTYTVVSLILRIVLVLVMYNLVYFLFFFKTAEFAFFKSLFKTLCKSIFRKKDVTKNADI